MPYAPGGLTGEGLERLLPALERLAGARLRVWQVAPSGTPGAGVRRLGGGRGEGKGEREGEASTWAPALDGGAAGQRLETPEGPAWFEPVREAAGVWLEVGAPLATPPGTAAAARTPPPAPADLATLVGAMLAAERDAAQVAAELSDRYEEIDLIYTISEILGHTIRLDEAAERILTEVSAVVGARRATLLVHDPDDHVLRLAAARGMDPKDVEPIEVDDLCSIAARVFRDMRIVSYDPTDPKAENPGCPEGRGYRGQAFLSVPVLYAAPGARAKPIGVINLTDRFGQDAFTAGDRKLVAAIANQVGAAIENARLVAQDLGQQRVRRELELARDLQLKLLPSPLVLAARLDVAARCRQAESVGGDFYNLLNLRGDRIGVMIGDVTSHGFGAALIMALVMAASGIHAEAAEAPTDVLRRIEQSLTEELVRTEMFLTVFYAVLDARAEQITFANAGHPHAFLVSSQTGDVTRLEATRPPLGSTTTPGKDETRPWRRRDAMLCLFTDGVAEALGARGERFGEDRVLGHVARLKDRPAREILEAVHADLAGFTGGAAPADDRTVVILKA
ncbi:MAG TPA: GAF domain-containing SpoIIE family protein phosphatase [Gemmatimonadales bacterium]|nr:GAF domain-containing SpoIIE family protein phosphatase [Gemmatimonadales bacterium]